MHISKDRLLPELERRIETRQAEQKERDSRYGGNRIRITSYMENIGWPELFGYRMQRFFDDPDFAIEQHLRQQIFWADNVQDDTVPSLSLQADVGMYWDATLFGQKIEHTDIGVPEFLPHKFQERFDPEALGHFDFNTTGDMPSLLAKYRRMKEIARQEYGGKITINFPNFHRGPLDIYVQMRGYEQFLEDTMDRPEELTKALNFLVDERLRFAHERQHFLGEDSLPKTTFVADDWVNIPFITPTFFREFVVPVYDRIRAHEGEVTGFHTCGRMDEVIVDLLKVFPGISWLDVSGWNDIRKLDGLVDTSVNFGASIINTVSLSDAVDEQRAKLVDIAEVHKHRAVSICAQAIVKLYPTYEEVFSRLSRFLAMAREISR